jgi:hypothetical protein
MQQDVMRDVSASGTSCIVASKQQQQRVQALEFETLLVTLLYDTAMCIVVQVAACAGLVAKYARCRMDTPIAA